MRAITPAKFLEHLRENSQLSEQRVTDLKHCIWFNYKTMASSS